MLALYLNNEIMKTTKHILILFLFFLPFKSFTQSFQITPPKLEFDGYQLKISYDFINNSQADQFYVWVEMEKKNGEMIAMESVSGDVGEKVKAGKNKQITWVPEKDEVFLNEEVFVEVKAEKYVKSFNKGSAMLMSTAMPGLGQTRISKGKPWWLAGVAAYGAIAGGMIVHNSYIKTYDSYRIEEDLSKRADLLNQAQQKMNLSSVLIVSGAALWAVNVFWVAITPNRYEPLQHVKLSLDRSPDPYNGSTLLSLKFNF